MHGTDTQWLPVSCQGIFGGGRTKGPALVDRGRTGMLTSPATRNNTFLVTQGPCMLRRLAPLLAVPLVAASATLGGAQQVLGGGDDAWTIPGGVVRLRGGGTWSLFNELYGQN